MLEFNVRGQKLTRIDSFEPAEKSVGYLKAKVNFLTDEWKQADTVKLRAKNQKDIVVHEADVVDGIATVPWEALDSDGIFSVSLFARTGDVEVTTNTVQIGVADTLESGTSTNPPTPTEFDKLRQDVDDLKEQVDNLEPGGGVDEAELKAAVSAALEEAKESGEFDGPKGDPGDDYVLTEEDKQEIAEMVPVPEVPTEAVLYTPQTLTAEQQKQARDNIAAWPIIDVVELPTEGIREDCFYRLKTAVAESAAGGRLLSYMSSNYACHVVNTLPEIPEKMKDSAYDIYVALDTKSASFYIGEEVGAAYDYPVGWYSVEEYLASNGQPYRGVVSSSYESLYDTEIKLQIRLITELCYYDGCWKKLPETYKVPRKLDIVWDGTTGAANGVTMNDFLYVKCSDLVPSKEDLVGTEEYWVQNGAGKSAIWTSDYLTQKIMEVSGMFTVANRLAVVYDAALFSSVTEEFFGVAWELGCGVFLLRAGNVFTIRLKTRDDIQGIDKEFVTGGILTSPNGTKFSITVSDDGVLSASAV